MYDKLIREIKTIDDKPTRSKKIRELHNIHKEDMFEWAMSTHNLTEVECEFIYKQRPILDWEDVYNLGDWFTKAVNFYIQCKDFLDKQ